MPVLVRRPSRRAILVPEWRDEDGGSFATFCWSNAMAAKVDDLLSASECLRLGRRGRAYASYGKDFVLLAGVCV